jgi:uncharacterized membrane protein YhfC
MTGVAIFLRVLNGILMLLIPCLAAYFLVRRSQGGFRPVGIGVAGFVLSQVGHIPFNQFLLLPGLERWGINITAQAGRPLLVLGLAAGLSAGLFEEVARYLIFRYWLREEGGTLLPWKYGIGHGGVEAIFTGSLALYALVQVLALGGEGILESFPAEQADLIRSQLEMYWAVPWHQTLLGAWERVSALLFHLGASVFVYKSVREKNLIWFLVAILGHTALNAFAVVAVKQMGFLLVEVLLFAFAVLWVSWAWLVRPREAHLTQPDLPPPPKTDLSAPQITSEQVEESRYE